MKKTFLLLAISATMAMAAGSDPAQKTAARTAPAKSGLPPGVPAGAVTAGPYAWRFTDAQGKKWLYRQTPFGVVKMDDKPEETPAVEDKNPITATDLGDSVRFERNTPFGKQKWTKKKSELNSEEQAVVEKSTGKE